MSNEEPRFILQELRENSILHKGIVESYTLPDSIDVEERVAALQDPDVSRESARNRERIVETLRVIPGGFFEQYDLPRENGLDVGCGSTGFMRNELLGDQIDHGSWTEIDVNPYAVQDNTELHPHMDIQVGSYHRLRQMGLEGKLDIVTGLSALADTCFLEHAVEEIAAALKPGGWFFHIQDVRPSIGICLQALRHAGQSLPFRVECGDQSNEERNILSFDVHGEKLSVIELFRRQMKIALKKTPSLISVMNSWVMARRALPLNDVETPPFCPSKTYYMNMLLEHQHPFPTEEAYAVITLAQKQ